MYSTLLLPNPYYTTVQAVRLEQQVTCLMSESNVISAQKITVLFLMQLCSYDVYK